MKKAIIILSFIITNSLICSDMINKVIEKQRAAEEYGNPERESFLKKHYAIYEKNFERQDEQKFLESVPRYEVGGNLSYLMSLEQITTMITERLKQLRNEGKLITKEEFEKMDHSKWYPQGQNLTSKDYAYYQKPDQILTK